MIVVMSASNANINNNPPIPEWTKQSQEMTIVKQRSTRKSTVTSRRCNGTSTGSVLYDLVGLPQGSVCFDNDKVTAISDAERSNLRRLGDMSTMSLVKAMFADISKFHAYMVQFIRCVSDRVDPYIKTHHLEDVVHLVFKGGNVLVDYFSQILGDAQLPAKLTEMLNRSDADFQFHIGAPAAVEHTDPLKRLVTASMYDFLALLDSEDDKIVPTTSDFIAAATHDAVFQVSSSMLKPKSDMMILTPRSTLSSKVLGNHQAHDPSKVCDLFLLPVATLVTGSNSDHRPLGTYITLNDTIKFKTSTDENTPDVTSFDLVRIKLNVDVVMGNGCRYHAPAELVDVAFSNSEDTKFIDLLGKSIDDWTQVRTFGTPGDQVSVRIPTLDYLVHNDLEGVLFRQGNFPWETPKYTKRLPRYILGCLLLSASDSQVRTTSSPASRWAWKCRAILSVIRDTQSLLRPTLFFSHQQIGFVNGVFSSVATSSSRVAADRREKPTLPTMPLVPKVVYQAAKLQFQRVLDLVATVKQSVIASNQEQQHGHYNEMIGIIIEFMGMLNTHLKMLMVTRTDQLQITPHLANNNQVGSRPFEQKWPTDEAPNSNDIGPASSYQPRVPSSSAFWKEKEKKKVAFSVEP